MYKDLREGQSASDSLFFLQLLSICCPKNKHYQTGLLGILLKIPILRIRKGKKITPPYFTTERSRNSNLIFREKCHSDTSVIDFGTLGKFCL